MRNTTTGVVVNVREDKVVRLGSSWRPADQAKQQTKQEQAKQQTEQTKQAEQRAEPQAK